MAEQAKLPPDAISDRFKAGRSARINTMLIGRAEAD